MAKRFDINVTHPREAFHAVHACSWYVNPSDGNEGGHRVFLKIDLKDGSFNPSRTVLHQLVI